MALHRAPQTGTHGTHRPSAHATVQFEVFLASISARTAVVHAVQDVEALGAGVGAGVGVGLGGGYWQLGSIG